MLGDPLGAVAVQVVLLAIAARCHAGDPVGDSAVGVARRVDGAGGARHTEES